MIILLKPGFGCSGKELAINKERRGMMKCKQSDTGGTRRSVLTPCTPTARTQTWKKHNPLTLD